MPTGGTSVLGSRLAIWRAKPRTSVSRNAQDACRSGGSVAHSIASFVVIVVALRFFMKVTKSASRRVWCSYLYPSPLRMLRYFSSAVRRSVIACLLASEAQCPQRLDVDLCVDPGGVVALVAQELTDLRQCCAGAEKLGGEAVPEDMGAAVCATFDAHAIESGLGDHRDRTSGSKADGRGERADEQPPTRRPWTAIAQICNDSRANVPRNR